MAILAFLVAGILLRRRDKALSALKESEQRLSLALDGSEQGMWDWDIPSGRMIVDSRWVARLGYDQDEIEPTKAFWETLLAPGDWERAGAELALHLAGETELYEAMHQVACKSGDWTWVLSRGKVVEWDAQGRPVRMAGTHRDINESKVLEDKRRESEERFRQLADNIQAVFWMRSTGGQVEYLNQGYEEIFQCSREAMRGDPEAFLEKVHPQDRARVRAALEALLVMQNPEVYDLEYRVQPIHGEERWLWDKAFAIRGSDGRPLRFCGLARDITERRRFEAETSALNEQLAAANQELAHSNQGLAAANEELRQAVERRKVMEKSLMASEERFRATFEQAAVGLAHQDLDGRYVRVNSKLCRILGYAEGELLKLNYQSVTHEDDLVDTLHKCDELVATPGLELVQVKRVYHKDGRIIWCRVTSSLVRDSEGKPQYFVDVVEDVTEARQAEQQTKRLAVALENSSEGVVITNPDGRIDYVNKAFVQETGYRPREVMGLHPTFLRSDREPKQVEEMFRRRIMAGRPWRGRRIFKRKDGTEFEADFSVIPVLDEKGNIRFTLGTARDLSER